MFSCRQQVIKFPSSKLFYDGTQVPGGGEDALILCVRGQRCVCRSENKWCGFSPFQANSPPHWGKMFWLYSAIHCTARRTAPPQPHYKDLCLFSPGSKMRKLFPSWHGGNRMIPLSLSTNDSHVLTEKQGLFIIHAISQQKLPNEQFDTPITDHEINEITHKVLWIGALIHLIGVFVSLECVRSQWRQFATGDHLFFIVIHVFCDMLHLQRRVYPTLGLTALKLSEKQKRLVFPHSKRQQIRAGREYTQSNEEFLLTHSTIRVDRSPLMQMHYLLSVLADQ